MRTKKIERELNEPEEIDQEFKKGPTMGLGEGKECCDE
jgi:hypothetical protein